eukprot:PITA_13926
MQRRAKQKVAKPNELFHPKQLIEKDESLRKTATVGWQGKISTVYEGWIPSLKLPIYIDNIHKAKHGSNSETYDTEGRFAPEKFDAIFSKYATKHPNKLNFMEIQCMLKANRNANYFLGWGAAELEWMFLYLIDKNKEGFVTKEMMRRMFDGSLM